MARKLKTKPITTIAPKKEKVKKQTVQIQLQSQDPIDPPISLTSSNSTKMVLKGINISGRIAIK